MKKMKDYISANKAFRCIIILTVIYLLNILASFVLGYCLGKLF